MAADRAELSVGAVVVEQAHLLLIERGRGAAVGQWSVPGGRVEPGESLAAAIEREVNEETGVSVTCGRFIGWVERIRSEYHFVIMDFEAHVQASSPQHDLPTLTAGDDAAAARWVPLDEVASYHLVDGLKEFLSEHGML